MRAFGITIVALALGAVCAVPASADTTAPSIANGRIVYQAAIGSSFEIVTADPDGTDVTQVTSDAVADSDPAFSRDGTKIAWVRGTGSDSEIYVIDANTLAAPDASNAQRLTANSVADEGPAWSHDGTQIAVSRGSAGDIVALDADGTGETHVTSGAAVDTQPTWSPDGSQIAFTTDRYGGVQIAKVSAGGGTPNQVTTDASRENSYPAWSPDGTRIAFASRPGGGGTPGEIYTVNPDGSGTDAATASVAFGAAQPDARSPAWAPEGNAIFFERNFNLYRLDLGLGIIFQITNNTTPELNPSWGGVLDTTAPTVQFSVPDTGSPYAAGATVASSFTCVETGTPQSGVATCDGPEFLDTSSLGTKTFTVTTSDVDGNSTTQSIDYEVTDQTGPTITFDVPATGSPYGVDESVPSSFSCDDDYSEVASCTGAASVDTSELGTHTFTVTATDTVGNVTVDHIQYDVTDQTKPTITLTAPANNSSHELNATVLADYACADAHSTVVRCDGTVADDQPIDTDDVGAHTFAVTAEDSAGNVHTEQVTYYVNWPFSGFFKPVLNLADGVNMMKAGRAVPIKFSLGGYRGMDVLDSPDSVEINCGVWTDTTNVEELDTAGQSSLAYDAASDTYTYVWKTAATWGGQCRDLRMKLDDGTARRLRFEFR